MALFDVKFRKVPRCLLLLLLSLGLIDWEVDRDGGFISNPFAIAVASGQTSEAKSENVERVVTQGAATKTISNLLDCRGSRISSVGEIVSSDGKVWTVPAENQYTTADHASDMFNQCTGVLSRNSQELEITLVPVVEIDEGGETYTAYLFADNYFEIYVNGVLIGVDPVPFTPFNSSMVRFKVNRPFTIAVKLVDWEENLGLGTEANRRTSYHAGDGGFVARFEDDNGKTIATTNGAWKAQTFYIAPVKDPSCIVEKDGERLSGECDMSDSNDGSQFYAAHYVLPANWHDSDFDDSAWPPAYTYTNDTVGVFNKPAYTNFTDLFDDPENDAEFIWSSNLILDNEVIVRTTIR